MKDTMIPVETDINKTHRRRTAWQRFVRSLAMVVIFCTTYALILPAITMQPDVICGMEAHTHTEECYEVITEQELICTYTEDVTEPVTEPATEPETEPETADEAEAAAEPTAEAAVETEPAAETAETEPPPQPQTQPPHTHDDGCWKVTGQTVLICTLTEHTHVDECYPEEPEQTEIPYTCGQSAHTHHESCQDAQGNLTCSVPVHTHSAECTVDGLDVTADIESAADWEQIIAGLTLTGNWREDLLTVAHSQMGYAESTSNCILVDDKLSGYTRYGDWYGNPYMEWDDVFIAFCLHYTGVPKEAIPRSSDTGEWLARLEQQGLLTGTADSLPEPGMILFWEDAGGQLRTGVVHSARSADLESLGFSVIAGDTGNRVDRVSVELDSIVAVCDPDLARAIANGEVEQTTEPEPTEPEVTEPEATEPEATEPEATEPEPTEPEVTEPEATEPAPTEPEATEPEATEPAAQTVVHTAETENYIVTVTHPASLTLPEGAQLRVSEYAKDSETYILRCQEAGYELEWLLNIGFFLGDTELTLTGDFDVVVTSKQGDALGQDITHFADSGTERLEADADGEEVSFTSGGFSDFGGGIATLAQVNAEKYDFVTVDPTNNLREGVDYVIYAEFSRQVSFLRYERTLNFLTSNGHPSANGDLHNPLQLANDVQGTKPYSIGQSWSLTASQMGTANSDLFTWRVVRRNGNTYLVNNHSNQELYFYNGWFHLVNAGSSEATPVVFNDSGNGAKVVSKNDGALGLRFEYSSSEGYKWRGIYNNSNNDTTVYFAEVNPQGRQFPHAVHTGTVEIDRLRFYNLCENGNEGVAPLAGCVFEITGTNGYKATVTSENDPELHLPDDIPDGEYTITEISVPDGYVRDQNHTRTFVVKNGALVSDRTIGTFLNHNLEQLQTGKTAEVEDYVNRIYQIDMTAKSNMRHFEMDPMDVLFVVDQSNSMLFPSGLNDTGKRVTLRTNGQNNVANMDALNLDKSQVYYIIADPNGTSTVWAVWHDGSTWMCQDASYYAKAKHANEPGYQDDNEIVIFPEDRSYNDQRNSEPEGTRSNGGGLGRDLNGSSLGNYLNAENNIHTFTVYTATDEFNRLHYLEEALVNLLYQMADVNPNNRATLTRFTRVVNTNDCIVDPNTGGPIVLNPDNVEMMAEEIQSIKTSGGTRQDIALKHIYQQHLSADGAHYSDLDHTYTLLITDGAPVYNKVEGSNITSLGGPNDAASTNSSTVYGQIKGWAAEVRKKSTLMTVGLGMESVEAGKKVLEEIASDANHYCAMDDASQLLAFIQQLLFDSFRPKESIDYYGDITDEISDSFYPIAWVGRGQGAATGNQVLSSGASRDWVLLEENDWITLDGRLTTAGASDAKGQLLRREDGTFYIQWTGQYVSGSGWKGTFYVKAKEDFIGGNAIDTNKEAGVTVDGSTESLDTPTVNVRLLPLNEMNSEVTVYLGDQINGEGDSPLDSLKYFYENTKFTKLIADGGDILNKVSAESADGLEAAVFYLRYAMGEDLTPAQWVTLANGDPITVPYTYDDDSSHGAVGYFTFQLEKSGHGSNYSQHEALQACQPGGTPLTESCEHPVETYILNVTYTAYELGGNGRPEHNLHNGTAGPGTEVGTGSIVENGLGTLDMDNVHEVHVISGKIEIIKRFADGVTDEMPRTFSFTLHRVEDGGDDSGDVTRTITIPANASAGSASIVFDGLRRGTYTVTEAVDEAYALKDITVLDSTNSYTEPAISGSGVQFLAIMGHNPDNEDVIGKAAPADRYTSYADAPNGVYAAGVFTNAPIVYSAEIPVEKIWEDGAENHADDAVYVLLLNGGKPVTDGENHRILRLDAANGWKGVFTVALADKDDTLDNYDYSVREVNETRTEASSGWHPAILENDGTLLHYDKTVETGQVLTVGERNYVPIYGTGTDGQLTVTNSRAVELPQTGGMGTHLYTFSGLLLLLAAALIYGYSQRREMERGASR